MNPFRNCNATFPEMQVHQANDGTVIFAINVYKHSLLVLQHRKCRHNSRDETTHKKQAPACFPFI